MWRLSPRIRMRTDAKGKVIAYTSRQLKSNEMNYTTRDLGLGVVVFALKIWGHYLYKMNIIVFTEYKSLQHNFNEKDLTKSQWRWVELLNDYECEIHHHLGKAKVVVEALSRKERAKPLCVKALTIAIHCNIITQIWDAQLEAFKPKNIVEGNLRGMDKQFEAKKDGT